MWHVVIHCDNTYLNILMLEKVSFLRIGKSLLIETAYIFVVLNPVLNSLLFYATWNKKKKKYQKVNVSCALAFCLQIYAAHGL